MRALAPALALLCGCGVAPGKAATQASGGMFDAAWARDPLWDDGLAEVSLYDAKRPQYDKIEAYQALLIVVKEDFTRAAVKADPPYVGRDLSPVLKLNAVHGYWTDNYPYHLLVSAFVRRDDPASLVKISVGRQEWCGNTFTLLDTRSGRARLHWHSYFEAFADGEADVGMRAGDLAEDALPLVLRGVRRTPGARVDLRVLPSLAAPDFRQRTAPVPAAIRLVGAERVATVAGEIDSWRVEVTWAAMRQTWWIEAKPPHGVARMEASDGRALVLRERVRKAYWDVPTFRPAEEMP